MRNALKRKQVSIDNPTEWLGTLELLHDCIHHLGGNCGAAVCDGANQEILGEFVDRLT